MWTKFVMAISYFRMEKSHERALLSGDCLFNLASYKNGCHNRQSPSITVLRDKFFKFNRRGVFLQKYWVCRSTCHPVPGIYKSMLPHWKKQSFIGYLCLESGLYLINTISLIWECKFGTHQMSPSILLHSLNTFI